MCCFDHNVIRFWNILKSVWGLSGIGIWNFFYYLNMWLSDHFNCKTTTLHYKTHYNVVYRKNGWGDWVHSHGSTGTPTNETLLDNIPRKRADDSVIFAFSPRLSLHTSHTAHSANRCTPTPQWLRYITRAQTLTGRRITGILCPQFKLFTVQDERKLLVTMVTVLFFF